VVSLNDISVFAMRWRPCANPHFSGDSVGAGGTEDDAAKTDEPAQQGGAADSSTLKKVPAAVPVARLEARRELMLFKRSSCAALRTQLNAVFFGGGGIPAEHLGIAKAPSFGKFEVGAAAKLRWDEDVKAAASATGSHAPDAFQI
jgi:hypothetical protein